MSIQGHFFDLGPRLCTYKNSNWIFLENCCTDLNQILYESFQVQGNEILMTGCSSLDQDGHHAHIYWDKVLPEHWELLQFSMKHEKLREFFKMHFEQAINHLSKSLNFILINFLQKTSFVYFLVRPTRNVRLKK